MMAFIRVDLPAPLRPISPTRAPRGIAAEARSSIVRPPRRTVTPSIVSMPAPLAAMPHVADDELLDNRRAILIRPYTTLETSARFDGARRCANTVEPPPLRDQSCCIARVDGAVMSAVPNG